MCPKHDTPCVLPEARGYTSWSASLTHWTADLWPLISPESQSDPAAHSLAPAGSLGSQLTQQYCVMLSYESLHTSAPSLHSGNQCQTKWTTHTQPCVCKCVQTFSSKSYIIIIIIIIIIMILIIIVHLRMSECISSFCHLHMRNVLQSKYWFFPPPHIFINTNINFSLCRYCKTKRNGWREADRKDWAPFRTNASWGPFQTSPSVWSIIDQSDRV